MQKVRNAAPILTHELTVWNTAGNGLLAPQPGIMGDWNALGELTVP